MTDTHPSTVTISPEDRRAFFTIAVAALATSVISGQIGVLCLIVGGLWSAMRVPSVQKRLNRVCFRVEERIQTVTNIRGWERFGRPLSYLVFSVCVVAVSLV